MKYTFLLLLSSFAFAYSHTCTAQDATSSPASLQEIKKSVDVLGNDKEKKELSTGKFGDAANLILNDPKIYNDVWSGVYSQMKDKSSFLKNLKIDFKTFQSDDSSKSSLGFSYNWDIDVTKLIDDSYKKSSLSAKINTSGNIAFNKNLNPKDFQQAKAYIGYSGYMGGKVATLSSELVQNLKKVKLKLADIEKIDQLNKSPLWDTLRDAWKIKNQYYYDFTFTGGWEGKQDFSQQQYTYGAQLRFSAKSYSDNSLLSKLNILDYPFAIIRYLNGTDTKPASYGAALPVITTAIEMVNPVKDTARERLTMNNTDQYVRVRFEIGFRTLLANVNGTPFHFNTAYRYFKELNAPTVIKTSSLDQYSFFTASITAANVVFVSYSFGNLPFDRTANAIYELGFKLNL